MTGMWTQMYSLTSTEVNIEHIQSCQMSPGWVYQQKQMKSRLSSQVPINLSSAAHYSFQSDIQDRQSFGTTVRPVVIRWRSLDIEFEPIYHSHSIVSRAQLLVMTFKPPFIALFNQLEFVSKQSVCISKLWPVCNSQGWWFWIIWFLIAIHHILHSDAILIQ